ncbi:uncharacterized protein J3D65DRAFT_351483 [Phyllosticta citribraziliensis]|uniref:Uncharacterized protein n=1 Tax=Phyllosticta citribraziliensis TaxID=989973 RepID=A0ABR1LUF8_9PEZI
MDPPSPKRRKPSPTEPATSVTETGDFRPRNQLRRTPPRRASYQSPTKASLSRFNPDILARRTSIESEKRLNPGDPTGRGQRARAFVLGETDQLDPSYVYGDDQARVGATKTGADVDMQDMGEDDLPERPEDSQPDLPPQEGLFSSPRKSPAKRNKSLGRYLSSPSKQAAVPGIQVHLNSRSPAKVKEPSPISAPSHESRTIVVESSGEQQKPRPALKPEPDPKLQEKEQLQARLDSLREDVEAIERQLQLSRNPPDADEDSSALISLINKQDPITTPVQSDSPPLAAILASFLPLAKRTDPPSPPPDEPDKPLPTHEPVELDDPYPYLSLFTGFKFTSSVTMGKSDQQVHSVSMLSPSSLLKVDFDMAVDIASKHIQRLEILNVSNWASHELGSYITKASEENDLGAVCSAITSYWNLASRRAACWARCRREFPHLLSHRGKGAQNTSGSSIRKTSDNQETPASIAAQDEEEEEVSGIMMDSVVQEHGERPYSKPDLIPFLDRHQLLLRSNQVLLRITWTIQFDWSGEAQSTLKADAVVPEAWIEADGRDSLRRVPETFDKLLHSRGAFGAIKVLEGVLFA